MTFVFWLAKIKRFKKSSGFTINVYILAHCFGLLTSLDAIQGSATFLKVYLLDDHVQDFVGLACQLTSLLEIPAKLFWDHKHRI